MKQQFIHLFCVCALLLGASACNNQPEINFDKTDYLALAHGFVGKTKADAEKILKKHKFTPQVDETTGNTTDYVLYNADSTRSVIVSLPQTNDTVKQYALFVRLEGDQNYSQAKALYTSWSLAAYRSLLADVSVWNATIAPPEGESTVYLDGNWMSGISWLVELYHASGEMDEEVYQYIKTALTHTRASFATKFNDDGFFRTDDINEIYTHATSQLDFSNFVSSLSKIRGNVGILNGHVEPADYNEGTPVVRTISFAFMKDRSASDLLPISGLFGQ